jgi:hypothetical protein
MKKLILIAGLLFGLNATAQQFDLVQINADWNSKNNINFTEVAGIPVKYARLEDQPPHFKATIKSVPTLILYVDGRLSYSWQAGIDLKCPATRENVAAVIKKFKN